jgi:hypothetical protein
VRRYAFSPVPTGWFCVALQNPTDCTDHYKDGIAVVSVFDIGPQNNTAGELCVHEFILPTLTYLSANIVAS